MQISTETTTTTRAQQSTIPHNSVVDFGGTVDHSSFLADLDSQTWLTRYQCSEHVSDPNAVSSIPAYAAWLRRLGTAWSTVPMPTMPQARAAWSFTTQPPSALVPLAYIDRDIRELAMATGGPRFRTVTQRVTPAAAPDEHVDAAYVAGALYVVTVIAHEVAMLAADVAYISETRSPTPLPQQYVTYSSQVDAARLDIRSEIATWAQKSGPQASERIILGAVLLLEAMALTFDSGTGGW